MSSKLLNKITRSYRNLSLQNIITIPFLLQIFVAVGLVGYLSWRNGERAVNSVTSQLRSEVTTGVEQHLKGYLQTPNLIVRLKQNSVRNGQLNVTDFSATQQDFWSTVKLFDSVRAIYIGYETGKFVYSKRERGQFYSQEVIATPLRQTFLLDSRGQKQDLVETDEYDPRIRPWYINTLRTQKNNWSRIYTFPGGELGITAAGLLKDERGNTQGIVGVDLILSGIGRFLRSIDISKNGQVFILERNGYLVATSTDEAPFTYDPSAEQEQRLRAVASNSSLVKATTEHLTEHFNSLDRIDRLQQLEFSLNNQNQLVQVVPYQDELGLDWLIVVVLPEADFMAEIESNTRNTILVCLTALAIATLLGIYTSRKIAQPIAHLSQVTTIIANSAKVRNTSTHFYPVIEAKSIEELKSLSQSFNEMVIQLRAAFRELEDSNQNLEQRVQQRTKALMLAKQAADSASRTKSEFLAKMSHELRTPLHAILGFTQVTLQDASLNSRQRANLLTVKGSGEHLLTLIDDVLAMSKIESGSLSIDTRSFDLHLLLDNLGKMFELRASQKNIRLVFNLPAELPQYIKTDPIKLNQILINLIENAIKFTDRGSVTLNLKTSRESSQTILGIAIIDTGRGISASQLESIFIPFMQTTQGDRPGTGLGLSICQQFVRLMGGEITVDSKLGQGSIFKFQIPIAQVNNQTISDLPRPIKSWDSVPEDKCELSPLDLTNMPIEWIEQLHHAAIAVDSDRLVQLIEEISGEHRTIAEALVKLVNSYCFDEIIDLTATRIND